MKYVKRLLSILLCLCIIVALIPSIVLTALAEDPWLWPTDGIYAMYRGYYSSHQGIDISAPLSTPVRATKAGTVIESKNNCPHVNYDPNPRCGGNPCNGGQGNYVKLRHDDGTYSRYLHLTQGTAIAVGTHVNQGDIVGYSGSSGDSSGPHLHFDCYNSSGTRINNNPTDPRHTYTSTHEGYGISYIYDTVPPIPTNASVSTDKPRYALGETVIISPSATGASGYTMSIWLGEFGSGEQVYGNYNSFTGSISFTPTKTGKYTVRASCIGSAGYTDAECTFIVEDPSVTVTGLSMPDEIAKGDSPAFSGVVQANFTMNWLFAGIFVGDISQTSERVTVAEMQTHPASTSFDLSDFFVSVDFAALNVGTYTLTIEGTSACGYFHAYRKVFSIAEPEVTVVGLSMPDEIGKGDTPSLSGVVQANFTMSWLYAGIFVGDISQTSERITVTEMQTHPGSNTYDLSDFLASIDFANMSEGTYTLTVEGTSACGYFHAYRKLFTICEIATACEHDYAPAVTTPTCTEQGYTTYTCSKCGDSYVDSYVPALKHDYQAVVTNATCTEQGYTKHTCLRCGDSYVDSYVDALDHDYELTGWQWTGYTAAKATFTCKNDSSHVQTVDATITHVRTEPTCEAAGKVVYTAKVTFEGKDYTDTKTHTLDALDHNWNTPTYIWAADNNTVTATRTCKNDASHVETETVNTTSEVTTPATCTAKGKTTYTVTFINSAFATQTKTVENVPALGHTPAAAVKEKEIASTCTEAGGYDMVTTCAVCGTELKREHTDVPALGHDWGEWCPIPMNFCTDPRIEDRTCNRCGATESRTLPPDGHTPGEPVKENAIAPTCEAAGGYDMVIYCTTCGAEISRKHTDVSALSHDWNEPEYVWADNYSTVTATRTCKNDASHKETETVNTTSEVTKPATYEAKGEIVYTATFENEAFATQTKAVATPKLEKPDDPTPGLPCDGGDDCPGNVFTDMPAKGNWAHDAIDWAIVTGVTSGTSETTFSPNAGCTRAQVVTFLWRAAGSPEPTSTNNPFTDVTGGYYYKAVLWAVENNITSGTSATSFSPNSTCTRAQIVTFLWRYEGNPKPTTTDNPFKDVKPGAYYEKAVLWASETGVTAGTSATTFSPDATCTRAQVVTFLYRDIEN